MSFFLSMQILFPGTLYITDQSTCFKSDPAPGPEATTSGMQGASPTTIPTSSSSTSTSTPLADSAAYPAATSSSSSAAGGASGSAITVWFKLPHKSVLSTSHAPGSKKKVGADVLKVEVDGQLAAFGSNTSSGAGNDNSSSSKGATEGGAAARAENAGSAGGELRWSVQFTEFAPASGLDGALALIEHLRESVSEEV